MPDITISVQDVKPGQMVEKRFGPIRILVCRGPDGRFHALGGTCAHMGGPLAKGWFSGTTEGDRVGEYRWVREGEIVRCPWHGMEYDVNTGVSLSDPSMRVRVFEATVDGDKVVVHL